MIKMDNFSRASGILLLCDDEVLLCRRSKTERFPGVWSIPSGHLNPGEDSQKGAKREFLEETGIKVTSGLKLVGFIQYEESLLYVYLKKVKDKVNPNLELARDGFEHDMCGWFTVDNLPEPISEQLKKVTQISLKV